MFLSRQTLTAAVVLASAAVGIAADAPAEGLRPTLAKLADKVAAHAKEKKVPQVSVVLPEGPTPPLANATPDGVLTVLKQELARAGVKVSEEVTARVQLSYKAATVGPDGSLTQLKVVADVSDPNEPTLANRFQDTVTDKLLLALLGGQLSGALDLPLNELARQVAERLDRHGGKGEVEVKSVQGPEGENHGIRRKLADALARQKTARGPVVVADGADARLRVTFKLSGSTPADLKYVFQYDLVNPLGQDVGLEKQQVNKEVVGPVKPEYKTQDPSGVKTLSMALPLPIATPPEKTDAEWLKDYIDRLTGGGAKNPAVVVDNEVRLTDKSDYGVQVWVGGKPLTPEVVNGHAVVRFAEGDEYQLVVYNRRKDKEGKPYFAAVGVRIDGLSIFALRDAAGPDHLGVGVNGMIPGWFVNNGKHHAFLAGTGDATPVKGMPPRSDTGTITVTFAPAWVEGQAPPVKGTRGGGDKPGVMGTQVGKEGKSEYKDEKLYHAEVQETLVIRYAPKKK